MSESLVPAERIVSKIIFMRGEQIILDVHLSELYGIETRALKQAVRRNIERFPSDFMFELTDSEIDILVSQNVIPSKKYFGGAAPFAFTEIGIAMLSSVLKSKQAVENNIAIMRAFVMLRKMVSNYRELLKKQDEIERKVSEQGNQILVIFEYLKQLEQAKQKELEQGPRKVIKGYRKDKE
jgi:hypothetical protein